MGWFLAFVSFFVFVWAMVGLVNPSWGKLKYRRHAVGTPGAVIRDAHHRRRHDGQRGNSSRGTGILRLNWELRTSC